jgi:copper(I)-binding protein
MPFRKLVSTVLLVLAAFALPSTSLAAHEDGPHVRFAHLANAPAVDLYLNGQIALTNLAYGDIGNYVGLSGYNFKAVVVPTGGALTDSVTPAAIDLNFPADAHGYFTVVAVGNPADGSFALVLLPEDALAGNIKVGALQISGAFARATSKGDDHDHAEGHSHATAEPTMAATDAAGHSGMGAMGSVSAAYMLISNTGATDEVLIAAETSAAGLVEIHQTTIVNDMASMAPMVDGLTIPALGSVTLKPGGYHIMLMDLKEELVDGQIIKITLKFASGASFTVNVPVVAPN